MNRLFKFKMFSIIRKYCNFSKIIDLSKNKKNIQYLNNNEVINIVLKNELHLLNKNEKSKSNFSGNLGEKLYEDYLLLTNKKYKKQYSIDNYRLDFVTDDKIIEIKTTIFKSNKYENIMFTPFKYFNISKKLKKNLDIIMIGYDKDNFYTYYENNNLFKDHINYLKLNNINYVFFKDLLKNI